MLNWWACTLRALTFRLAYRARRARARHMRRMRCSRNTNRYVKNWPGIEGGSSDCRYCPIGVRRFFLFSKIFQWARAIRVRCALFVTLFKISYGGCVESFVFLLRALTRKRICDYVKLLGASGARSASSESVRRAPHVASARERARAHVPVRRKSEANIDCGCATWAQHFYAKKRGPALLCPSAWDFLSCMHLTFLKTIRVLEHGNLSH